jgi:Flp pilus assembly protein TadB
MVRDKMRKKSYNSTTQGRRQKLEQQSDVPDDLQPDQATDWRWWSFAIGSLEIAVRQARRLAVLVIGSTVVVLGVVMLVTPGPAVVVIPIGLGILAIEFVWARRLLRRVKYRVRKALPRAPQGSRDN